MPLIVPGYTLTDDLHKKGDHPSSRPGHAERGSGLTQRNGASNAA